MRASSTSSTVTFQPSSSERSSDVTPAASIPVISASWRRAPEASCLRDSGLRSLRRTASFDARARRCFPPSGDSRSTRSSATSTYLWLRAGASDAPLEELFLASGGLLLVQLAGTLGLLDVTHLLDDRAL